MTAQFDDEELSMSLSSPLERRGPRPVSTPRPSAPVQQVGSNTSDLPTEGRAGQRIGQYSVKKTLGEGSFGKVKLAVHRVSGQEVALKIIPRKKLVSRDMAGRVEREIQYLQLLRHPHIIKLYTVITTPSEIIMVLEYAGGELFDYLVKHGKMSEDKARRFFQQIVCAVEYCHRHKIVHRDLKPENLLLDNDLNVKIADFGLSNIMTDGNFLKTSCGSPNYAAPEVISGKLYAGPEVDVWSCGVILYVLLVGRLPFDDEFIPALFKKISSGNYHMPSYLSSGARHIIHKMLKVNPVQRITIQDIRQDAWFNENLEDYLKPPVEEFIDTGVDPNKAIDPRQLAPGKPPAVQEQIHESVIGKLGKTMGYAKDDVQEALGKDEPNAIKDAYLIVRENQIMSTNPALTTAHNTQPFLAQSPPAWNANMPSSPQDLATSLAAAAQYHTRKPSAGNAQDGQTARPQAEAPAPAPAAEPPEKEHVSKIGILASSIPYYHNQYMEKLRAEKARAAEMKVPRDEGEELEPHEAAYFSTLSTDTHPREQSAEAQAATARALKPHSRSTIQLQRIISNAPEKPETSSQSARKSRTKWQFGIRSRNLPHEAIHCIYKALKVQGAQWEVDRPKIASSRSSPIGFHRDGSSDFKDPGLGLNRIPSDEIDPAAIPDGYIPKDPWLIRVRWLKEGMCPPGTIQFSSANNSRVDLGTEDQARRRESGISSLSSAAASTTSFGTASVTEHSVSSGEGGLGKTACFVYMDVQLYTLEPATDKEPGTYLVDFKCSGYESIVEVPVSETEKKLVGSGNRVMNKDVSSPQPFLDLTNKLVIHLAKGG